MEKNDISTHTVQDLFKTTLISQKITKYNSINDFLKKNFCLSSEDENLLINCLNRDIKCDSNLLHVVIIEICDFLIKTDKTVLANLNLSNFLNTATNMNNSINIFETIIRNCIFDEDLTIPELLSYNKAFDVFKNIYKDFSIQKLTNTLQKLIPKLFSDDIEVNLKNFYCDCALILAKHLQTSEHAITDAGFENKDRYLNYIRNLIECSSVMWHKLCIFLIRYFGERLHVEINLANSILQIIQCGFERKIVIDKIHAYDCWIELIDNYSLNRNYLYKSKHITLLVKPLKIRLSRNERVLIKCFHVWTHFLTCLQEKSEECLEAFLNFSFVPVNIVCGANGSVTNKSISILPKEIWPCATEMLITLFGHHNYCLTCLNREKYSFAKPVITKSLFTQHYILISDCVVECLKLLLLWAEPESIQKVTKCLGRSLLDKISEIEDAYIKDKALKVFSVGIIQIIEKNIENTVFFDDFLRHLLNLVIEFNNRNTNEEILSKMLVIPLIKLYMGKENVLTDMHRKVISDLLNSSGGIIYHKKFTLFTDLIFFDDNLKCECKLSLIIWSELGKSLINWLKNLADTEENNAKCNGQKFLLWFIQNYDMNYDENKENLQHWESVKHVYFVKFPQQVNQFLDEIIKLSKNKSILTTSFVYLFSSLRSYFEVDTNLIQAKKILSILIELSVRPYIVTPSNLLAILKYLMDFQTNDKGYRKEILKCVENLILIQKVNELLPDFARYVKRYPSLQSHINSDFKIHLSGLDNSNIKDELVINLLTSLNILPKVDNSKNVGNDDFKTLKIDGVFQFFGREINKIANDVKYNINPEIKSPKTKKNIGSKINSLPKPEDDDSAKYVLINDEYEFDPKKLSKHQKEKFKRPRDDIPALYQDLSQSRNNTYEVSNSSLMDTLTGSCKVNSNNLNDLNGQLNEPNASTSTKQTETSPSQTNASKTHQLKQNRYTFNLKKFKEQRVNREMKRIKMDVVGADDFRKFSFKRGKGIALRSRILPKLNINISRPKRTYNFKNKTVETNDDSSYQVILENASSNEIEISKKGRGKRKKRGYHLKKRTVETNDDNSYQNASNNEIEIPKKRRGRKRKADLIATSKDSVKDEPSKEIDQVILKETTLNTINISKSIKDEEDIIECSLSPKNRANENVGATNDIKKLNLTTQSDEGSNSDIFDNSVIKHEVSLSEMDTISVINISDKDTLTNEIEIKNDSLAGESSMQEMSTLTLPVEEISVSNLKTETVCETPEKTGSTPNTKCNNECLVVLNPTEEIEILLSSPVTDDTPNRIKSLMNETHDISPIRDVKISPKKSICIDLFNRDNKIEKQENIPEKTNPNNVENKNCKLKLIKVATSRSATLLNLIPNHSMNIPNIVVKKVEKESLPVTTRSPRSKRLQKIFINCEQDNNVEIDRVNSNNVDAVDTANNPDILTFCKDLPNLQATPKSSILKRKAPDSLYDDNVPSAKKKKVNFCDPPTTSEILFLNDKSDSESTENQQYTDNLDTRLKKMFADIETDDKPKIFDNAPIYPNLIECTDSVKAIIRLINNVYPPNKRKIEKEFQKRNILTVGDFAKLTLIDIGRLPLQYPKLAGVTNAFKAYEEAKQAKNVEDVDNESIGSKEISVDNVIPTTNSDNTNDLLETDAEINAIVENIKSYNLSQERIQKLIAAIQDISNNYDK